MFKNRILQLAGLNESVINEDTVRVNITKDPNGKISYSFSPANFNNPIGKKMVLNAIKDPKFVADMVGKTATLIFKGERDVPENNMVISGSTLKLTFDDEGNVIPNKTQLDKAIEISKASKSEDHSVPVNNSPIKVEFFGGTGEKNSPYRA